MQSYAYLLHARMQGAPKKVLVATDDSPASQSALSWYLDKVVQPHDQLHIVSVALAPPMPVSDRKPEQRGCITFWLVSLYVCGGCVPLGTLIDKVVQPRTSCTSSRWRSPHP